jgi:hypothetical protein
MNNPLKEECDSVSGGSVGVMTALGYEPDDLRIAIQL